MKIFDAAHVQHLQLSNATRTSDGKGGIRNKEFNHIFLTPTFDINDPDTFNDDNSNKAMARFTKNLAKNYGCSSYLWVKEYTKVNRDKFTGLHDGFVPHYHMLLTLPFTPIFELNKAWSTARGDLAIRPNALRSSYDKRTGKPYMKIRSYRAAVGYAAKYAAKGKQGNVCRFELKCKLDGKKTMWPAVEGHTTKCYGMSANLRRDPRQLDLFMQFHLHPWITREYDFYKNEDRDIELYMFNDPLISNMLYNAGTTVKKEKPSFMEYTHTTPSPNFKDLYEVVLNSDQYHFSF